MRSGAGAGASVHVTIEVEVAVAVSKSAAFVAAQVISQVRAIFDTTKSTKVHVCCRQKRDT